MQKKKAFMNVHSMHITMSQGQINIWPNCVADGSGLLYMDVRSLLDDLNISDTNHQNAFHVALESLRESGVRMPRTVWEYRVQDQFSSFLCFPVLWVKQSLFLVTKLMVERQVNCPERTRSRGCSQCKSNRWLKNWYAGGYLEKCLALYS